MTNDRPSRDTTLMDTAHVWARRSTCDRAHVGAVISRDGRTLSTGYNGAPAGMPHCVHHQWTELDPVPVSGGCTVAVHAEANAIAWAARHGVKLDGAEMHTTRATCPGCAKLVVQAGIVRVVFYEAHRDMTGVHLLDRAGIDVWGWANLPENRDGDAGG